MITYTTKYESGCLLNSSEWIKGPSCFGLCSAGAQLASDAALGLKLLSIGLAKAYLDGRSYMKGGSIPIARLTRRRNTPREIKYILTDYKLR